MIDYKKTVITSIVSCPECDSKNVFGEFNTKMPSNPKEDFLMIHCFECGLLATKGVGDGTLSRVNVVKGVCGHGVSPSKGEYETGYTHCQICKQAVGIVNVEVV